MPAEEQRVQPTFLRSIFTALAFCAFLAGTAGSAPPRLVLAPLSGSLDTDAVLRVLGGIREAEAGGALRHVVVELALKSGELGSLMALGEGLFELRSRGVITVALILGGSETAPSTLIACACKEIALGPGARIGALDALGLGQKNGDTVRAWSEAFGRSPVLSQRMLDRREGLSAYHVSAPDQWLLLTRAGFEGLAEAVRARVVEEKELCKPNEPLILDPADTFQYTIASQHGFITYRAEGRSDLMLRMNLVALKGEEIKDLGGSRVFGGGGAGAVFAEFCQKPIMRFLLILIGLLCLFLEFQTPGIGLPGLVSLACFGVLFGTGLHTGHVDYWELGLFIVGCTLVALEILVLPGFGVAGILGVVCILVSLVLAMVKNEPSGPLDMHALLNGIITTLLGGLGAGVGVAVLGRVMLKNRFVARIGLIHGTEIAATSEGDAGTAGRGESKAQWPIGAVGAAETMLRPAGKARIEGKLIDVVAESEVIPAGTPVIVVKKVGPMTVVRVHKRAGGANGNE